jgi:hypothetical protein
VWFEDSPVFRKAFELHVDEDAMPDGSSIERPFRLGDINRTDFKPLLRLLARRSVSSAWNIIPAQLTERSYGREGSFEVDEWISILKLSVMWGFQAITTKVIGQVFRNDTLDPLAGILLARDCGLSEELLSPLSRFTRQRPLNARDVDTLGLDYFLKILEVQERIDPASMFVKCARCHSPLRSVPFPTDRTLRWVYNFSVLLQLRFEDEIKRLNASESSIRSSPEKDSEPAGLVHLEGLEKDDTFFYTVFFRVS